MAYNEKPHGFSPYSLSHTEETETLAQRDPDGAFPMGSNERPLVINFDQRLKYKNAAYFQGLPKPIDTLYDKVYYGKVDRFQNVIVPRCFAEPNLWIGVQAPQRDHLKQISSNNSFAFDFVADNFFSLKRNLKIAGDEGYIESSDTRLYEIEAVSGILKYNEMYNRVLQNVLTAYGAYINTKLPPKQQNKIQTFESYVEYFLSWLKRAAYRGPISLTETILNAGASPRISGLVISIGNDIPYGEDLPKYTEYFQDVNFPYYARAARKFGFYIDRNAPWRLFADPLSSPMMNVAIADYNTDKTRFFNTYYARTYKLDLPLLQRGLVDAWNRFARNHKRIVEAAVGTKRCPPHFRLVGNREVVSLERMRHDKQNMFWFYVYIRIRSHETGVKYPNLKLLAREAVSVAVAHPDSGRAPGTPVTEAELYQGIMGVSGRSNVNVENGLLYINNLFKPYMYDERLFKKHLTSTPTSTSIGYDFGVQSAIYGGSSY